MKRRYQRARRLSRREHQRRIRQQQQQQARQAARAEKQERHRLRAAGLLTEPDVAASASGVHRIPPGLLTFGGATTIANRTQMRGR